MNKDSSLIRTILFNILVILTVLFIYFMFFPKKSYVKEKLDSELNPLAEETFNQNINSLKIAGETYFENNDNGKITLKQLRELSLLAELKDTTGKPCNEDSYVEKTDSKMIIHLNCEEKEDEKIVNLKKEKLLCIYQYEKKLEQSYTNWSDWSNWTIEEITADDLTNVETKVEKESNGTKTITEKKQLTENAKVNTIIKCPTGYSMQNNKCMKKTQKQTIDAKINSEKKYYCPENKGNIEYTLSGKKCNMYEMSYQDLIIEDEYSCPTGYNLSNTKCYKTIEYNKEVEDYNEVTYYRYQTREKETAKIDIKWSTPDDKNLLDDEYTMVGKIACEF